MDTLEQLKQRVENAVRNLAMGMIAGGGGEDLLPIGDISVDQTSDGVVVKFVAKVKAKRQTEPAPDKSL